MSDAFDTNVSQLVAATVSAPVLAAGWFHVHVGEGVSLGGFVGVIATGFGWLARKQPQRWPAHAYWVITVDDVWVLDLMAGSSVSLRRVVGRWKRADVSASEGSAAHRAVVEVPGRPPVEVEGDRANQAELEVVRLLVNSA